MDKLDEGDNIEQVKEDHFEEKKDDEDDEEKGFGKKPAPKMKKWLSWWKKRWPATGDLHSKVQLEKEKSPRAEPDKDSDKEDRKQDKTCVGGHDRAAKTKDRKQLEGPHMLHNTKYKCEDLLGMKTKVSTVKVQKKESTDSVGVIGFGSFSINHFMGSSKESEHDSI